MTECVVCYNDYDIANSTAKGMKILYCSEACESIETQRLEEGNKIIESAKANGSLIKSIHNATNMIFDLEIRRQIQQAKEVNNFESNDINNITRKDV